MDFSSDIRISRCKWKRNKEREEMRIERVERMRVVTLVCQNFYLLYLIFSKYAGFGIDSFDKYLLLMILPNSIDFRMISQAECLNSQVSLNIRQLEVNYL